MPLYEYHCKACDALFTRIESMEDHAAASRGGARPACPKCNSSDVEPVFSDFFAKTVRKS